jgi:hypothetical protein
MARTAATQNSRRARRGLVGGLHDDRHQPCVGLSRPPSPQQQRGQVYHRFDPPGHRADTKSSPRAVSAIAYSLLLDRRCARRVEARPAASCSQQKLAVRLWARDRAAVRIERDSRVMQQNASLPWRHGAGPLAPLMQQDAACHARRDDRARTRMLAQETREPVRRYTHAGPSRGASRRQIRSACRLVRSSHEPSSSRHPSVDPLRGHLLTCAGCWPLAKRRLVRTSS